MNGSTLTEFCTTCHFNLHLLRLIGNEEVLAFNSARSEVIFNTGENIIKQGAPLTYIACINTGYAKVYLEGVNKNLLLDILKPGDFLGGPGLLTDNRNHYSVVALTKVKACLIEPGIFYKMIETSTGFVRELLQKSNHQVINNYRKLINLTQKHMHGRMADVLIYLCQEIYQQNPFTTTLSRQDISDLAALSKETSIRIMKEFKESGLLNVNSDTFEILDLEGLKKISLTG